MAPGQSRHLCTEEREGVWGRCGSFLLSSFVFVVCYFMPPGVHSKKDSSSTSPAFVSCLGEEMPHEGERTRIVSKFAYTRFLLAQANPKHAAFSSLFASLDILKLPVNDAATVELIIGWSGESGCRSSILRSGHSGKAALVIGLLQWCKAGIIGFFLLKVLGG